MRRGRPRGSYRTKPVEKRGKQGREFGAASLFWKNHSMDDIITKTPEELDAIIDTFLKSYEERQLKLDPTWWYPQSPKDRFVDIRKAK